MVVGNNESTATKNAGESMAILIARQCSGTMRGASSDGESGVLIEEDIAVRRTANGLGESFFVFF